MAMSARPKPEIWFLPGWLWWALLLKERYGDTLSSCASNTQPFNWEVGILPLS